MAAAMVETGASLAGEGESFSRESATAAAEEEDKEGEEAATGESEPSGVSSMVTDAGDAAVREAEALLKEAEAAAAFAANYAAAAAGDATSSSETLSTGSRDESSGDKLPSSPEGDDPASAAVEHAEVSGEEVGEGEEVLASPSTLAALQEKERRDAEAREELDGKKRRIRNEALSSVAEEMEVASAGLKRELEQSMLKDLKDLDEDSLRFRVAQLATELQERTKWEALRLMDGVQKKEAEISEKYEALLSEQKERYDGETGRALREQEKELSAEFVEKYGAELRVHLEHQANEFKEALHANAVAGREALEQELQRRHADIVAELKAQDLDRSEKVVAELRKLSHKAESKIMEVEAARNAEEAERLASERVHRVTHATLSLTERFTSSAPIKKELDNLRRLAGGDPLLEAAAESIPANAAAKGIPTVSQLKQRHVFGSNSRLVDGCSREARVAPFCDPIWAFVAFFLFHVGHLMAPRPFKGSTRAGVLRFDPDFLGALLTFFFTHLATYPPLFEVFGGRCMSWCTPVFFSSTRPIFACTKVWNTRQRFERTTTGGGRASRWQAILWALRLFPLVHCSADPLSKDHLREVVIYEIE
ncbi:unnamed protein product [Ectocarpus sp. 13 AM-2016]